MAADQAEGLRRRAARQSPRIVHGFFEHPESAIRLAHALHAQGWATLLADTRGPFGTPITDDHRVVLQPDDRSALLVAYVPAATAVDAGAVLGGLAGRLAGVRVGPEWRFA
mgnify:CR=1 FL=1